MGRKTTKPGTAATADPEQQPEGNQGTFPNDDEGAFNDQNQNGEETTALANRGDGAIATYEKTGFMALDMIGQNEYFLEAINDNLGDDGLTGADLERYKLPSGESRMWNIPGPDGPVATDDIQGIIIYHHTVRGYWPKSIEEVGSRVPPQCSSRDGKTGDGNNPGGECRTCALNVYGTSRNGRGKACQEKRLLYILVDNRILPVIVQAPATSLKPVKRYMLDLLNNTSPRSYWHVLTSFKLETIHGDPMPYPQLVLESKGPLEASQIKMLKALRADLLPKLKLFSAQHHDQLLTEFREEELPEEDLHDDYQEEPAYSQAAA